MTPSKPEYHLQRLFADGTAEPPLIYPFEDSPAQAGRKPKLIRSGITAGAALAFLGGCAAENGPPAGRTRLWPWLCGAAAAVLGGLYLWWCKRPSRWTFVRAHYDSARHLAFTPDGTRLVTATGSEYDKTFKLWSFPEGRLLQECTGHNDGVRQLLISPNGQFIASAYRNKVRIWFLPNGRLLREYDFSKYVGCMVITPDSRELIVGQGKQIVVWSLANEKLRRLEGHTEDVKTLAVTPDGKLLISACSSSDDVSLWVLPEGRRLPAFTDGGPAFTDGGAESLRVTPDNGMLILGRWNARVELWSLADRRKLLEINEADRYCVSSNGAVLAAAFGNSFRIWSLSDGKLLSDLIYAPTRITSVAIKPDGTLLACMVQDGTVELRSVPDGALIHTLPCKPSKNDGTGVWFSPDGRKLITGHSHGTLLIWDVQSGRHLGCIFDQTISDTYAKTYSVLSPETVGAVTYALPRGSKLPAGATCACNCVLGTKLPQPEPLAPAPPPPPPPMPTVPPRSYQPPGSTSYCTCNKICTCIPVCQAHRLLHPDPVVRRMAEELLLVMGDRELEYLHWAAGRAEPDLRRQIQQAMTAIQAGASPNPARWPTIGECRTRLNDPDEIICIMAAQLIALQQQEINGKLSGPTQRRVDALLDEARRRPWYLRRS